MKTETSCKQCQKLFLVEKRELNRGKGLFCSRSCSSTYNNTNTEKSGNIIKCAYCGTQVYKTKSKQNTKSKLNFCSRVCKDSAQKIGGIKEIQPPHYGTTLKNYRDIIKRVRDIDRCDRCGYEEHPEILQIHHKDRNRDNNLPKNLEVLCPNCHLYEHFIKKDGLYNKIK